MKPEPYAEKLERKTPTWPKETAKASWIAPLLGVAANIFLRSANGSTLILGLLMFVLATLGVFAGLIALSRVPKYGKKGILIPALIGTLLSTAYLLVGTATFVTAKQKADGTLAAKVFKREAKLAQKTLPQDLGDGMALVAVSFEAPKTLVMDYTVKVGKNEELDLGDEWRESLVENTCSAAFFRRLEDPEAAVLYRYTINGDTSNRLERRIEGKDCG